MYIPPCAVPPCHIVPYFAISFTTALYPYRTPGVSAEPEPGYFTVTDPATAAYTEPYWGTLSVRMYAKTNAVVGYAMLAAGSVVAISSVAGALCLHAYLLQKNLIS